MEEGTVKRGDEPWRVLEFYSGIGGMRYSLQKAGVKAKVVEAFDVNDKANDVYEHNFGHRPHQGNIQSLTAADLDKYGAHAWLLSPPCQPYTRQGLQKHSGDARASSFLKILELVPNTKQPPDILFVENVVGFETSDTHMKMMEILARSDFVAQEFILSPLQFGVPYSRPRYFCLAKRKPLSFLHQVFNNQLLWSQLPLSEDDENTVTGGQNQPVENWENLLHSCEPVERFLEFKHSSNQGEAENRLVEMENFSANHPQALETVSEANLCSINQYFVPLSLKERWGDAMGSRQSSSLFCPNVVIRRMFDPILCRQSNNLFRLYETGLYQGSNHIQFSHQNNQAYLNYISGRFYPQHINVLVGEKSNILSKNMTPFFSMDMLWHVLFSLVLHRANVTSSSERSLIRRTGTLFERVLQNIFKKNLRRDTYSLDTCFQFTYSGSKEKKG